MTHPRRPLLSCLLLASFLAFATMLAACSSSSEPAQNSPTPALSPGLTSTAVASQTPAVTASPTATVIAPPTSTSTPADPASLLSGERAYDQVVALADDIGSRAAGSPQEAEAADYIASQLASYGYQPTVESFGADYYVEQTSLLEVLSPEAITIEARALRLSASGETTDELVTAGIGRPEDFPPGGPATQVALVERGELTFSEKVANAAAAGATAVVVYNNEAGPFRGDLEEASDIPAVGISQEDGQRLLGLLAQGTVTVHVSVEASQRHVTSRNVVARPPDGRCERVVGAHYDSIETGPGANDNASGVAVLLETARVLAASGETQDVCFVAFGAEEIGLTGSQRFVAGLSPDERATLRGMVNLDMVGVGDQWQLIGSPELAQEVDVEAANVGLDPVVTELPSGLSSDHVNFIAAGIPAVLIHRVDDPRYHSAEDQAQFVQPQLLEQAGELGLLALGLLAQP